MLTSKVAKRVFQYTGVGVGAFLIVLLVIPLLGPVWHALHGDSIYLDGWKIPVPKGFYVSKDQKDRAMWRLTLGIPLFNGPYGHISFYHLRPTPQPFVFDRDYPQFRKAAIQEASHSGYRLNSEHTVSVERVSGYCLDFMRPVGRSRSLIRCAVENSPFFVFYEGDPRYVPDVFTTLQGMSLESPRGGSSYQYDEKKRLTWTYDASRLHLRWGRQVTCPPKTSPTEM